MPPLSLITFIFPIFSDVHYPTAFAYWLSTLDFALGPFQQVVLIAPPGDPALQSFTEVVWHPYHPRRVIAVGAFLHEAGYPALLKDRRLVNGRPTAYFYEHFTCQLPAS